MKGNIAKILNAMVVADLKMQKKGKKTGIWDLRVFKRNTKKLKKIISKHGWPTISLVGKKASYNAWLIIQHSDYDLVFQKKSLKLMEKIFIEDPCDINIKNIAFLKDRILINQGKKQIFGTQFYVNKKGSLSPKPIVDIRNVEKRRKKYGMRPFKEDLESAKKYKRVKTQRIIK